MNTKAITCWADESEIIHGTTQTWIVGQLIVACDNEFTFLQALRDARKRQRTWDTMHANNFTKRDQRRWELLQEWIQIFKNTDCYYHAFVYDQDPAWRGSHPTQHHYFAHQACFGLGTKMRISGPTITTLFSAVNNIFFIMDRRAAAIGGATDLESIYEEKIRATMSRQSSRGSTDFKLRFTFANSTCFDGLQFCDCLTSMLRSRYLSETGISGVKKDLLELWNKEFLTPVQKELKDFQFDQKMNYFRSNSATQES